MDRPSLLPLAVSMGEPAGIGPDLILQIYSRRAELKLPPFVVFGHLEFLRARARRLGVALDLVPGPDLAATAFQTALPVFPLAGDVPDRPGEIVPEAAPVVIAAITEAVAAVRGGRCCALVTAPIHKGALYGAGFGFPGHTEFLADLCSEGGSVPHPVMMLAHDDLRAVPLTVHVPLADVPRLITAELLVETGRILARDLVRRFGIARPRLGVAGLNPHAGEGGAIGREDIEIIAPAIGQLALEGIDVAGPIPADTLFHPPNWRRFDAVVAMYHDQALIPIKTLAFEAAVNVTLGLPIVRTSPDHGTAFDLAGSGRASPESFIAALRLAARLSGPA